MDLRKKIYLKSKLYAINIDKKYNIRDIKKDDYKCNFSFDLKKD